MSRQGVGTVVPPRAPLLCGFPRFKCYHEEPLKHPGWLLGAGRGQGHAGACSGYPGPVRVGCGTLGRMGGWKGSRGSLQAQRSVWGAWGGPRRWAEGARGARQVHRQPGVGLGYPGPSQRRAGVGGAGPQEQETQARPAPWWAVDLAQPPGRSCPPGPPPPGKPGLPTALPQGPGALSPRWVPGRRGRQICPRYPTPPLRPTGCLKASEHSGNTALTFPQRHPSAHSVGSEVNEGDPAAPTAESPPTLTPPGPGPRAPLAGG